MMMESCIYIFLASLLTFRYGVANEAHSIINTIVSVSFLTLIVVFSYGVYAAISKNKSQLEDE